MSIPTFGTGLRLTAGAIALAAVAATSPSLPLETSTDVATPTAEANAAGPTDATNAVNPACDHLDDAKCLFPFPNDFFTVADDSTATGRRVDLSELAMPRNTAGRPIDPTEWNRNDGWSPGAPLLTFVPGLDLPTTWGTADRPEGQREQLTDLALSLAPDSPIVVVNAETGERHPFWAELDMHPDTADDERTLIIRPARNWEEATRYVVGLRNLRTSNGTVIEAGANFTAVRDGNAGGDRQAHFDDEVFPVLADAGVARDELYLAWDFTVASAQSLAGRVLHIRDDAFSQLGDSNLADVEIAGDTPTFEITNVTDIDNPDDATLRIVEGTVTVPNYLQYPQDEMRTPSADDPTDQLEDLPPFMTPGSRFYYGTPQPGPTDLPQQNPLAPTLEASFVCSVPRTALDGPGHSGKTDPATPMLYGHGLLGSKGESRGGSTARMRERNFMPCGVDWIGMATEDLPNVATILADMSNFPSLADRAQQAFLNFLYVGRAMAHPDGFVTDPAFQTEDGQPLIRAEELVYDGNSQGGIMGGALTALAPDFTRATIGVPGMNYSTLLNRSVDWEGAYAEIAYAFYPDKMDQQLMFGLIQMLWDRAEANGYAHHMTDDPLPNTPPHQVLMQAAFGDYQVANVAAEVEARTIGAARIPTDLEPGRHWAVDPLFGFDTLRGAWTGSALVYFDSGNPTPPNANVPPEDLDADPHEDPRRDPYGADQKDRFYRRGQIVDVHHGDVYHSYRWPERSPNYEG